MTSADKLEVVDDASTYTSAGVRYQIVAKRWGLLALVCLILFLDLFSFGFFSFINDVTSIYFQVEPAVTDLQAIVNVIGRCIGSIVICFFGDWMHFRNITLLGIATTTVGALLITIGVMRKIFSIVVFGMFLNGCSSSVLLCLILVVPTNWFPPKERGKANAITWMFRRLSYLFSILISTRALDISYAGEQLTHDLNPGEVQNITEKFKKTFGSVFGSVTLLSTACCVLSRIYIEEHPPIYAEDEDSTSVTNESSPLLTKAKSYDFKREFKYLKSALTNPSLLLITFVYAFTIMERPVGVTLASSLILKEFPETDDQFVGIMLCVGIVAAATCSPLVGQILDKFSKPRTTFLCLASFSITALVLFSVFFQVHNIAGVFTSFLLLWSARDSVLVCLSHRLIGIMSHQPEAIRIKAFNIPNILTTLMSAISTIVIRKILENYGSAVAVLFPLPFSIFGVLAYTFLWSYLRDGGRNDRCAES